MSTVLVVTDRHSVEDALAPALQMEGSELIRCPGPQPADYMCPGGRGGKCPLAKIADVVVLDTDLASDLAGTGATSWRLLRYYSDLGLPVVALTSSEELEGPVGNGGVVLLPHSAPARSVAAAVLDALTAHLEKSLREELEGA